MPNPLPDLEEIFSAARDKQGVERTAYLDQVCAQDPVLRRRVEQFLSAQADLGSFLEGPAVTLANAVGAPALCEGVGTLVGPYRLREQIGEGGFGLVFMAEQQQPVQRQVAVKILKPGMDSRQVIARFEAERQALALMDHPNIAKVLDAGETGAGRPYFAMELVRGASVTDYCAAHGLDIRARLELFVTICHAVQHAHHKGIIHRDIKPTNLLVATHDEAPVVKVIDFGIAKALGQHLTEKTLCTASGYLIGTPLYMSPEQAEQSPDIDMRTDIYSMGVLLYELLTGTTPFDKDRLREAGYDEMRRIIREEEPPKPSVRLSTLAHAATTLPERRLSDPQGLSRLCRTELDWVVMKALEKDRSRRYETASAFAADVDRYLRDEPVTACPPSAWYRFGKFARRRRGALAMAAVITASLVLLAGSLGWMARDHAERESALIRDQKAKDETLQRDQAAKEAKLAGEKAAREGALDAEVTRALDEAVALIEVSKWQDAKTPVYRAHKLLVAAGRAQLPPRLLELQCDLAMLERLENILEAASTKRVWHFTEEEVVEVNSEFTRAFREFGIDVPNLTVIEAAKRIQAHSTRVELAWAVDFWSTKHKFAQGAENMIWAKNSGLEMRVAQELHANMHKNEKWDWKHMLRVAKVADPDPWRNRLRDAIIDDNQPALKALAASAPIRKLRPGTLFLLGNALLEINDRPAAMALLRSAQRAYPSDARLSETLGFYYTQNQPAQHDEAARFFTAALAVRPHSAYLHWSLGRVLAIKGLQTDAIDEFSKAVELDPNYLEPWKSRGSIYIGMNRPEAIGDFTEVIKLMPNAGSWLVRGGAYQKLGERKKAIADFSRAIELDPKLWLAYTGRSQAHAALEQWDEAAADLDMASKPVPKTDRAYLEIACYRAAAGNADNYRKHSKEMLEKFGDTKDPIVAWRTALSCLLVPGRAEDLNVSVGLAELGAAAGPEGWGRMTRGLALYRTGQFQQSVQQLQLVLKPWNNNPGGGNESLCAGLILAMAHHRLGQTDAARQWLDKATRVMDLEMSRKELGIFRSQTHVWAMCLVLRREAEGLIKN